MSPWPSITARARAAATARSSPLDAPSARARLAACDGPIELALAFEAAFGGLVIRDYELGLDTHRTHPPRDDYDEWLEKDMQRRMVQIGFGPHAATYWLDARGWVHEICPLDRLRPHSADVAGFLEVVLGARRPSVHLGVLLLHPCTPDDADAIFASVERCPVGQGVARLPEESRSVLEEHVWVDRVAVGRGVIVSAPTLDELAEPLARMVALDESIAVAILDGDPWPSYQATLTQTMASLRFMIPWHEHRMTMHLGRDAEGRWRMVRGG